MQCFSQIILQPLNRFLTHDYSHSQTRILGKFQSLPDEQCLGICETAASNSACLLLYRTQLLTFQPADTGRDIMRVCMYMCVPGCIHIPLITRKFQCSSKCVQTLLVYLPYTYTQTHKHPHLSLYAFAYSCIDSIFVSIHKKLF